MAFRAVFDANVLISGLVFGGIPGRCLEAVEAGKVECVTCTGILADVADKLTTKFGHTSEQLADELAWLVQHTRQVDPPGRLHGISRDPDDDLVLECAFAAEAGFLVTGDADLLDVKRYEAVAIITPREFLNLIQAQSC